MQEQQVLSTTELSPWPLVPVLLLFVLYPRLTLYLRSSSLGLLCVGAAVSVLDHHLPIKPQSRLPPGEREQSLFLQRDGLGLVATVENFVRRLALEAGTQPGFREELSLVALSSWASVCTLHVCLTLCSLLSAFSVSPSITTVLMIPPPLPSPLSSLSLPSSALLRIDSQAFHMLDEHSTTDFIPSTINNNKKKTSPKRDLGGVTQSLWLLGKTYIRNLQQVLVLGQVPRHF